MLKGVILGACMAIFFVSVIIITASLMGGLSSNIVTGFAIIKPEKVASTSIITLVVSFVIGMLLFFRILGKF